MASSIPVSESLIAIDIGPVITRALFFDVVDGQYRFVSSSNVQSTFRAPYHDVNEGIFEAISHLEQNTIRTFFEDSRLVIPARSSGYGVDQLVMTSSAGPLIRIVILGLLEDVSLASARHLAGMVQGVVVDAIGLNDPRRQDSQIDIILQAHPDLLIITGGTNSGATRSMAKIVETLNFTLPLFPRDKRPEIIFAGNEVIANQVKDALAKLVEVHIAPNIRPEIGHENLAPAAEILNETIMRIRARQIGGFQSYQTICTVPPVPTHHAFGRVVRFLSKINNPTKGVMGIDLGPSSLCVATAEKGNLNLSINTLGIDHEPSRLLNEISISDITRWTPGLLTDVQARDLIWQKSLQPGSTPATSETLALEHALARELITLGLKKHNQTYPQRRTFEPILVSGQTFSRATPGQSMMILLDSLQPQGVTTFIIDPYGIAPAIGAISNHNALMPVQVIESNAFINLGTVITAISKAKYGTPILRVKVEYEIGEQVSVDVRQGVVTSLPIQSGQSAQIHLQPLRPVEIYPGRKDETRSFKIVGGLCGVVIDTRGRPLILPSDMNRSRDVQKKWLTALGG